MLNCQVLPTCLQTFMYSNSLTGQDQAVNRSLGTRVYVSRLEYRQIDKAALASQQL